MSVTDELQQYLSHVERATHASLRRIQRALEQSGLNFDKEFVHRFQRFATNRIYEAYDSFEVDATLRVQSNGPQERMKRGYNESEDDIEKRKKARSKSPSRASSSSDFMGVAGSSNGNGTRTGQKHVGTESDVSSFDNNDLAMNWRCMERNEMYTSTPRSKSHSMHGSMENSDGMARIINGYEQSDKTTANELSVYQNQCDELDQNRSVDSGVNSNGNPAFGFDDSPILPHALTFTCFHCASEANTNVECFNRIEAVHAHWIKSHWSQDDEPFKVCIIERVNCYYCDVGGSYQKVIEHQKKDHADKPTVIAAGNKQTCALCPYEGLALIEHFPTEHKNLLQTHNHAAFCLTDDMLNSLLQIHTRKIIGKTLKMERNMDGYHHMFEHFKAKSTTKLVIFDQIEFAICGCQSKVNPVDYLNHIENHRHDFHCSKCQFKADSLIELVTHDRNRHQMSSLNFRCLEFEDRLQKSYLNTKLVFKNGLVIAMSCLMNTKFDIFAQLTEFIDKLVAAQKEEYFRKNSDECSHSTQSILDKREVKGGKENHHLTEVELALKTQANFCNGVFVVGIHREKDENLLSYVLKLCRMIHVNVSAKDIESVSRPPGPKPFISVRFTSQSIRDKVMDGKSKITLWSKDFNKNSRLSNEVIVDWMVAYYFRDLNRLARESATYSQLHAYRWTERGLFVQRTSKSKGKYVVDSTELQNYIK
ncbi:uncharacterized protein LOC129573825 [Sitodiplosis mosellana]|uniref:uncharacterized protein LOC129573825 n=1 Tax=Sitodiplosis mosellana TaxID=263140 RepID=UPI002443A17C|nr:uncharacterized protein LOC129573825 [Sitodiplosis mosellana]